MPKQKDKIVAICFQVCDKTLAKITTKIYFKVLPAVKDIEVEKQNGPSSVILAENLEGSFCVLNRIASTEDLIGRRIWSGSPDTYKAKLTHEAAEALAANRPC